MPLQQDGPWGDRSGMAVFGAAGAQPRGWMTYAIEQSMMAWRMQDPRFIRSGFEQVA